MLNYNLQIVNQLLYRHYILNKLIGVDYNELDKVKDIYFNNVRVKFNYPLSIVNYQLLFDKRPCKGEGFIKTDIQTLNQMSVPLYVENASVIIK